jgi:hypothetical protein
MVLVKILKRRDATSVIVAVLIAMIVSQPLYMLTGKPASIISGLDGNNAGYYYGPGGGWQSQYLYPVVWVLVQLLALEIIGWIYLLVSVPAKKVIKKR